MMVNNYKKRRIRERLRAILSSNHLRWSRDPARANRYSQKRLKKEEQAPPDLDEIWRDFTRRLNRLFKRKATLKGGPSDLFGGGGGSRYYGLGACGLLIALWLGSGFYLLRENQASVVMQFGAYKYTTTSAGLQWHLPYPLQSNEFVDMSQTYPVEIKDSHAGAPEQGTGVTVITQDGNIVKVRLTVKYRVNDASAFLLHNLNAQASQASVIQASEAAVRETFAKLKIEEALYHRRERAAHELMQAIQQMLDAYRTGVLVTNVVLQDVQLPAQVQAVFDEALKVAEKAKRKRDEASVYANRIIARARSEAAQLVGEAERYKTRVIAQAQGETQRFEQVLAEYLKAPAVTRERMYLETMQQIYANSTKVLVDGKAANNLIYLPLEKLLAQKGSQSSHAANASSAGAKTSEADKAVHAAGNAKAAPVQKDKQTGASRTIDNPLRARDALRGRERAVH